MSPLPRVLLLALLALPAGWAEPAPDGARLFAACAPCHAADSPTRTGPDLRGVIGRRAGSMPGFRYSRALQRAGFAWGDETLDAFLADPQAAVPGNTMPFPGLPDDAQRRALISYLKTLK